MKIHVLLKVFGVELSAPTAGSELGVAFAQIFIVERGEGTWKAWAQANTQLNDVTIDRYLSCNLLISL